MGTDEYILCVDDDDDDCQLLDDAIQKQRPDFNIKFINSGEKIITFLSEAGEKKCLPKLIILDINMLRMNGIQTLVEIEKICKHAIPILFLTTSPRNESILFGQKNVAFTYNFGKETFSRKRRHDDNAAGDVKDRAQ